MKKLEAVIFDWAGTTVDYGCFAPVQAFAEVFKAFGIEPTMEEVREPMGMLKRDHIKTMLAMPRIRTLWEEKYGRPSGEADIDSLYQMFEGKLMSILAEFLPGAGFSASPCICPAQRPSFHKGPYSNRWYSCYRTSSCCFGFLSVLRGGTGRFR